MENDLQKKKKNPDMQYVKLFHEDDWSYYSVFYYETSIQEGSKKIEI